MSTKTAAAWLSRQLPRFSPAPASATSLLSKRKYGLRRWSAALRFTGSCSLRTKVRLTTGRFPSGCDLTGKHGSGGSQERRSTEPCAVSVGRVRHANAPESNHGPQDSQDSSCSAIKWNVFSPGVPAVHLGYRLEHFLRSEEESRCRTR